MKSVKYAIIGAVIGLSLGGLLSIGVVGSHSACEGANGCFGCIKMCSGGCADCLSWWITPVKGPLYASCGFFGFSCSHGCIDDWDCSDSCFDGCTDGCIRGCDECSKGCGGCGDTKCTQGCTECSNGCESDCNNTQEELSNDPDAKKKIKNYLIYLTIIGTVIGAVFGIVCDIQKNREKRREAEKIRLRQEEEEKRHQQEQRKISCSKQLIFAAGNNDKDEVLNMLEQGADVNYKDSYGDTPLSAAVTSGNVGMTVLLLEKGADIKRKFKNGFTPLRQAASDRNKEIVSLLIEGGANVNSADSSCRTALDFAIVNEDMDLVSLLLEKGATFGNNDSSVKNLLEFAIKYDNADLLSLLAEKTAREDIYCEDKPLLFFAIEKDYKRLVELLIEKGVHKKARCAYGDFKEVTPLFFAVMINNKNMVSLLLENKVEVDAGARDSKNHYISPLCYAVNTTRKEIVPILIDNGANINYFDGEATPLMVAVMLNNRDMISFLIEKGADINGVISFMPDKAFLLEQGIDSNYVNSLGATGSSPLVCGITSNKEELVSFLIEKGADVNLAVPVKFGLKEFNITMLQKAICEGNKKIISLLLDADAKIDINTHMTRSALIDAIDTINYDSEIVSLLIEKGADVNLESVSNGHTPLTFAVSQNNKYAALLLLKNGADPNKKSGKFGSPLMIAFQAANKEMCSLLMENGANPNDVLCASAAMPNTEVAQFFLDRGADVNGEGLDGYTPLHCAVSLSTKEMVLLLISYGADVNHEIPRPSEKNAARTPLESAIITGNAEMVSLLITYGADVNYKTKNGNTPLLFAALHGKSEIVPLLKEAGAVSNAAGKSAQTTAAVATNRASSDVQDDSVAFNAALVVLSKIIAKNGAEIFAPENSQKLKALVSDLIPQENEIAAKLKQALSCDFAKIMLDATDKSDGKKEKSFGEAVDTIAAETGLEREAAVSIVKLVALALDWDLESVTVQ